MTWWDKEIAIIKSPWEHQKWRQLEIRDASLGGTFETSIILAIAGGASRFDDISDEDEDLEFNKHDEYTQLDFTLPEMLELQEAVGKAIKILEGRSK